jgi:hypothetical protein
MYYVVVQQRSIMSDFFSRRGTGIGFRLPVRSKLDRDKIWRFYASLAGFSLLANASAL